MERTRKLEAACSAVGLGCQCDYSHSEPGYKLNLIPTELGADLSLVMTNDDSVLFEVLDQAPSLPGILLEVCKESVSREPIMDLWLPNQACRQYLIHRQDEFWVQTTIPGFVRVATVAEALAILKNQGQAG